MTDDGENDGNNQKKVGNSCPGKHPPITTVEHF